MKDDEKNKIDRLEMEQSLERFNCFFFGVDWAEGSGNTRGDIISKENNVVTVRFKTVS